MKYREVLEILTSNGFYFKREGKGSHTVYEAIHSNRTWTVILAYSHLGDDIRPNTLRSIIRQSGLPKDLFRN